MPSQQDQITSMIESLKSKRGLLMLGALLLFAALFILNSFAAADGDYFWHVNTGRWIWEHQTLPVTDPFTFTVEGINPFRPESGRIQFILKQYWLAQLTMYSLWQMWGDASIVVLRALINSSLILAVFCFAWRRADFYRALILGALTLCQLQGIGNERPQLFTFLFTVLLILFLEKIIDCQRLLSRWIMFGLPLMMLVWANMHGGYILGLCIIAAYAVGFVFEKFRSSERFPVKRVLLLLVAGVITAVNPAGLPELIAELFSVQSGYVSQVQESKNTIQYFWETKHLIHPYVFMFLLTTLGLSSSLRKMHPAHLLTIGGVLIVSLLGVRYETFLFLIAPIMVQYLPFPKKKVWATLAAAALIFPSLINTNFQVPLVFAASSSFPSAAVEFMRATKPAPNLFNQYDWGGYLVNRLPEYQVFIDGRGLVEEHYDKHNDVVYKEDLATLDEYNINTVVFPLQHLVTATVVPLAVVLSYHPDWEAVFLRENSMIFLRRIPENQTIIARYAIAREPLFRILIDIYDRTLERYPNPYRALATKALLQENIGDFAGAVSSLKKAQAANPESTYTKQALQRLMDKMPGPGPG